MLWYREAAAAAEARTLRPIRIRKTGTAGGGRGHWKAMQQRASIADAGWPGGEGRA